ncbi:hypothetical protein [Portibacter marinus]|uniref:hypothetical protein n=1 Tax=Portibacter marinus TaxID=2898660 RepID=UPI001F405DFE|nr:hypothetical protein [Portibacter marinus]
MNTSRKICIFLLLIISSNSIAQKLIDGIKIDFAHSESTVDTRLTHLENRFGQTVLEIIQENEFTRDTELYLGVSALLRIYSFLRLESGIGYSLLNHDFKIPIKAQEYFTVGDKRLYLNESYNDNRIQLSLAPYFSHSFGKFTPFISFNFLYNISFHKSIKPLGIPEKVSKTKINLSGYELIPELGIKYGRISVKFGYRLLNRAFNDPAIFDPEVEISKTNPTKYRMTMSFFLYNKN